MEYMQSSLRKIKGQVRISSQHRFNLFRKTVFSIILIYFVFNSALYFSKPQLFLKFKTKTVVNLLDGRNAHSNVNIISTIHLGFLSKYVVMSSA